MFASMMRLVTEQQDRDGAIRHREFDTVEAPGGGYTAELRASVKEFIRTATPQRHSFVVRGQPGITYFDRRGRATSAVLDDLDDDELAWIAMSMNPRMAASGSSGHTMVPSIAEDVGFTLTPKSRTQIEKFVFAKFPPDQKKKTAGRMTVMFSGETAKLAGAMSNEVIALDKVQCGRLVDVARLLGYTGSIEKLKKDVAEEVDVLPDGMTKFVASIRMAVERDHKLTDWKPTSAGNVRAQIAMVVDGTHIVLVIDGTKRYGNNSSPVQVTNTWIAGNPKVWGGASIAKTMSAIRQVLSKTESRLDEKSNGPVRTSRDAMDPTISVYSVAKSDMDEVGFAKWLKAKGIHAKVQKTSDGFRAVEETVAH